MLFIFIFHGSNELVVLKNCEMTQKINHFLSIVFHIDWITVENKVYKRHTAHKKSGKQQRATSDLTLPLWAVGYGQ